MRAIPIFGVLLICLTAIPLQAQEKGVVDVDHLNLREGPTLQHSVLDRLARDENLKILETEASWLLVQTEDGQVGWVYGEMVAKLPAETPNAEETTESTVLNEAEEPHPEETEEAASETLEAEEPMVDLPTQGPPMDTETEEAAVEEPAESKKEKTNLASTKTGMEEELKDQPPAGSNPLAKPVKHREFREVSLSLRPSYAMAHSSPAGIDDTGIAFGAHVSYFIHPYIALHIPFRYTRYGSNAEIFSIGGGPQIRYLDWKMLRGTIDGNFLYVRALGGDRMGWSVGGDFMVGFKKTLLRPFLGPFFRVEDVFLPGRNVSSMLFGIGITLTNFSDLD